MAEFTINPEEFTSISGKVVVITGGSSGIGLETTRILLEVGASVVVGDLKSLPDALLTQHGARLKYVNTDVSDWSSLQSLFKAAIDRHKRVDHVFAGAAIPGFRADYLTESFDPETGALQEPSSDVFNINLRGCINTAYLALYHMRHQSPAEGSIVLASSGAVLLRFRNPDYNAAKSGLVGLMRGLVPLLNEHPSNIRLNCISPSWTRSGMLELYPPDDVGYAAQVQDTEVVARSVVLLMADGKRHGQNIYIREGKFWEMEEDLLHVALNTGAEVHEDVVLKAILKHQAEEAAKESHKATEE